MQMPEDNIQLVKAQLSEDFNLPVTNDKEQLVKALAEGINHLIQTDFTRLINMLYRVDVSENNIKETLEQQADEDAGLLIARLIIERLIQKQQMRAQFKTPDNIPDDDKW